MVEVHDAFNSLLPIGLVDLGLVEPDEVLEAAGRRPDRREPVRSPRAPRDRTARVACPSPTVGGLKARGHPVGGTGLFQIAENYLQITERSRTEAAQVPDARIGISHSIGGPGNNNYVTILERSEQSRTAGATPVPKPTAPLRVPATPPAGARDRRADRDGCTAATVLRRRPASTSPRPRRHAGPRRPARPSTAGGCSRSMDHAPREGERHPSRCWPGQKVKLLVKDDGDHYFQIPKPRGLGRFDVGQIVDAIRRRVGA